MSLIWKSLAWINKYNCCKFYKFSNIDKFETCLCNLSKGSTGNLVPTPWSCLGHVWVRQLLVISAQHLEAVGGWKKPRITTCLDESQSFREGHGEEERANSRADHHASHGDAGEAMGHGQVGGHLQHQIKCHLEKSEDNLKRGPSICIPGSGQTLHWVIVGLFESHLIDPGWII